MNKEISVVEGKLEASLAHIKDILSSGRNVGAIDLGNSLAQACVNGKIMEMPNAIAPCHEDVTYYDEGALKWEDNLVVEVDSGALHNKREKFFVGISATRMQNNQRVEKNNIKAKEDRSLIIAFTMLAFMAVQNNVDETVQELDVSYDMLTSALPTRQVKNDRDGLKKKLSGNHTVTFHFIPGREKPLQIKLNFENVFVGIEGHVAFLALTRDWETLKVKDESLMKETILLGDLGGGSFDPVGIKEGKIIDGVAGEPFGINEYLDKMIVEIENNTGFMCPSRYLLEEKLIAGSSNWSVVVDQEEKKIDTYIKPQLTAMSQKFLESIMKVVRGNVELQSATKYFAIGGAVKAAKTFIEEENKKRSKPMKLEFPDHLEILNLIGLWILALIAIAAAAPKAPTKAVAKQK